MTTNELPVELPEHDWLDDEAGPVVRPYAVTRGRSRPSTGDFDLLAYIVATPEHPGGLFLVPEHRAILERAAEPVTVAELAAHLDLAVGVVRVLLGDLLQQQLVSISEPAGPRRPDERVLKAVIHGLRSL